jgi:hypothetical protein
MKKPLLTILCALPLLISCTEETPRAELLEYNLGGTLYTPKGYAYRYTDYSGSEKKGFDWHIYNLGQRSLYIQAYDASYTKTVFTYPDFEARLIVEMADGKSKVYQTTSGEFRITGQEMGDVIGDFHFKVKNITNPLDSLMINSGYFRIWLERYDRVFTAGTK